MKTIVKPSRTKVIFFIIALSMVTIMFSFLLSINWDTKRDYKFALILYSAICGGYIYLIYRFVTSKNKIIFEFDETGITVYGRSNTKQIFFWDEILKVNLFIGTQYNNCIYLIISEPDNHNEKLKHNYTIQIDGTYKIKIDINSVMNSRSTFKLVQNAFNQYSKYSRV